MKIYENNRGFQLGNLLYLLLQAHRDRMMGYEESYVLRTGYFQFAQTFFPKTAVLFSKANGIFKRQVLTILQKNWTLFVESI